MIIVCIYRIDWSFSAIKGYHFMSMGDIIDFLQLRWRNLNLRLDSDGTSLPMVSTSLIP